MGLLENLFSARSKYNSAVGHAKSKVGQKLTPELGDPKCMRCVPLPMLKGGGQPSVCATKTPALPNAHVYIYSQKQPRDGRGLN